MVVKYLAVEVRPVQGIKITDNDVAHTGNGKVDRNR
jgi:hypothetical protein